MEQNASHRPAVKSSPRTTVILFCGLPASGKSTLARQLEKSYDGSVIHLEYDALEDSMVAEQSERQRRRAWNQARQVAISKMEDHFRTPNDETTPNDTGVPRLILMDDNFHLRGMRKQIHRILLNHKPVNFGIIWVETPLPVCLERNLKRKRQIPVEVIEKMSLAMEPPRAAWESSWIQVGTDTPLETVFSFLESCQEILDLPEAISEEQQEADRRATAQSQSHNWDKLVRGWVGKVAKYDNSLARKANDARKTVLQQAKEQNLTCTEGGLLSNFVDLVVADGKANLRSDLIKLLR